MKGACEGLLLVLKNMLRYYDNLEKDYYRDNGINQQLDMKKECQNCTMTQRYSPCLNSKDELDQT